MRYKVVIMPSAEQDLVHFEAYLAERFYPINVIRFIDRLSDACQKIALAPYQGTRRDDLGLGIRVKGFERRVAIHFVPQDGKVTILGMAYGGHTPRYLSE